MGGKMGAQKNLGRKDIPTKDKKPCHTSTLFPLLSTCFKNDAPAARWTSERPSEAQSATVFETRTSEDEPEADANDVTPETERLASCKLEAT